MARAYRVPVILTVQPEGGFTVISPLLPGLVTEGDSIEEALDNTRDALLATLELYEDTGRPLPSGLVQDPEAGAVQFDLLVPGP
jgi:antitoxin HicB